MSQRLSLTLLRIGCIFQNRRGNMITENTLVTPTKNSRRWINAEMKEWLKDHQDHKFRVERIVDGSVKLYKIDFWITLDLLQEIN